MRSTDGHVPGEPRVPPALKTDALAARIYQELKHIARVHMRRERGPRAAGSGTLQTTLLVHEAFLRLRNDREEWENPDQFKATCALAIRRFLTDHARRSLTGKRGGSVERVELDPSCDALALDARELLDLDAALDELRGLDDRQARVVELRFFGGLTIAETAEVLRCSPRTVDGDWSVARAWLRRRLEEGPS